MSTTKHHLYYQKVVDEHQELFDQFKAVHDAFAINRDANEERFHSIGRDVLDLLRDCERRLCSGMERGGYASYSGKLAEKFWALVRQDYPLIDQVGVHRSHI